MRKQKKPLQKLAINEFHDINKFPAKPGICVLGISMPKIDKSQSPSKFFKSSIQLIDKIKKPEVGDVIVYSDGLYMHSNEQASKLKLKFQRLIDEHKRGCQKLIKKDIYLIASAFHFTTWNQLILECDSFPALFEKLREIYSKDESFQNYVKLDITTAGKEINENTINYILEEVLLDYLVAKGRVKLQNEFVRGREEWILNCYNGKPHRAHAYIHQNNLLNIKSNNPYQNGWYDLDKKKLYEFERMDIASFNFED